MSDAERGESKTKPRIRKPDVNALVARLHPTKEDMGTRGSMTARDNPRTPRYDARDDPHLTMYWQRQLLLFKKRIRKHGGLFLASMSPHGADAAGDAHDADVSDNESAVHDGEQYNSTPIPKPASIVPASTDRDEPAELQSQSKSEDVAHEDAHSDAHSDASGRRSRSRSRSPTPTKDDAHPATSSESEDDAKRNRTSTDDESKAKGNESDDRSSRSSASSAKSKSSASSRRSHKSSSSRSGSHSD